MLTSASEWRWIPTALNVADQGTRLQSKISLSPESPWIKGPAYLREEPDEWPKEDKDKEKEVDAAEVVMCDKKVVMCNLKMTTATNYGVFIPVANF